MKFPKFKDNKFDYIYPVFVAVLLSCNIISVLLGYMTKEENWFTMAVWSLCLFMVYLLELVFKHTYKKLSHNAINDFGVIGKENIKLMGENLNLIKDNLALIEDNKRLSGEL